MIKKGITSIGDNAFRNFKNLKEISIPSTVKKIGCYSFYRTALKEITVPATVKTIGQCAFYQIEGLEKLTMPGKFHLKTKKGEKAKYYLAIGMGTVIFNTPLDLETAGMMSAQNFIVSEKDPNYKSIQGVIYSKDGKSIVRMPLGRRELVIQEGCEEFCLQSVLYCCEDLSSDSANEAFNRSCNLTYTDSATEMKAMFSFWYSSITKGKQPKVKMILDWSKITGADGYQIIIAQDKKFKTNKRTLTAAKSKKRIHVTYNLEEKKTNSIYAKIRPYKMQKGKKLYGRWTLQSTINPI